MAVITALFTVLISSQIDLYTDSKSVIDKFYHLNSCHSSYFCYPRLTFKDTYSDFWFLLFTLIQLQQLTIRFHKVKAHGHNYQNNYTDRLAKSTHLSSDYFCILPHILYSITPQYKQLFVALPLHFFVKDLTDVLEWTSFIQLNRNTKYKHSRINWFNMSRYI